MLPSDHIFGRAPNFTGRALYLSYLPSDAAVTRLTYPLHRQHSDNEPGLILRQTCREMSAIFEENITLPNPLRSTFIPPQLLADNAEERIRDSTTFEPFAFITTKHHATLPLSIHNYNHRSFWSSSPLSSLSPKTPAGHRLTGSPL
jgi:hypothetical protein